MIPKEAEGEYLDARYNCMALRITLRRTGFGETKLLDEGIQKLCEELRIILRELGKDKVSEPFPPGILEKSPAELAQACASAASKIAEKYDSKAGAILSKVSKRILEELTL